MQPQTQCTQLSLSCNAVWQKDTAFIYALCGIVWRCVALDGVGWHWVALGAMGGVGWRWVALGGVGWRWVALGGVGWRWVALGGVGWRWVALGGVGWRWVALGGVGRRWVALGGVGWLYMYMGYMHSSVCGHPPLEYYYSLGSFCSQGLISGSSVVRITPIPFWKTPKLLKVKYGRTIWQ